jgi:hypothetical protein
MLLGESENNPEKETVGCHPTLLVLAASTSELLQHGAYPINDQNARLRAMMLEAGKCRQEVHRVLSLHHRKLTQHL